MVIAVISVAIASLVITYVAASTGTSYTPLYTFRMEQASSKMNFLPTEVNEFIYGAEKGHTLGPGARRRGYIGQGEYWVQIKNIHASHIFLILHVGGKHSASGGGRSNKHVMEIHANMIHVPKYVIIHAIGFHHANKRPCYTCNILKELTIKKYEKP